MKLALCCLNSKYIHSALAPWYLGAGVDAYCHEPVEWEVVEGTINQTDDDVYERLLAAEADVFGFCCYIWNIQMVLRLARRLAARFPERPILLGGPEVSFRAEALLLEESSIHFILCGEGERPLAMLLDRLSAGQPVDGIPGLVRRTANGILSTPSACVREDPPDPYTPAYLAALDGRIAYLETSRGCPFSCAFCLSGRGDNVRFFDLERAKRDILLLANAGVRTVKFVDRTFNCNPRRSEALIRFILDRAAAGDIPSGVCFHLEVAADLFDEAQLRLLNGAPAGLFQLEAGLQSFQKKTLEAVTRKTDLDRLCRNLRRLLAPGNLHVHIDLIAGLPHETLAGFASSFDQAYALAPHMLQLGFLKLLYGSRLRAEAEQYGYVFDDQPPYEMRQSNGLSAEETMLLHAVEDALERLYNSGRFRRTLALALEASGQRPFVLLRDFGLFAKERGVERMPLDAYTALVLDWFRRLPGLSEAALRDAMTLDSLCSRAGGLLPPCLRQTDERLKQYKRAHAVPGRKLGVALLALPEEQLAVVDYGEPPDPVTGQYPLRIRPLPSR